MSTMLLAAACLFALPLSSAFRDSSPLVAWSPQRSDLLLPEETSLPLLLQNDALCSFESVVVIDQPGVRASDLRSLHASSVLSTNLKDAAAAPFSYQVPYSWTLSSNELASAVEGLASRCGAQLVQVHFDAPQLADSAEHRVIYAQFPSLPDGLAWERKQALSDQEGTLSSLIASVSPNSLFVFTGSAVLPFMGSELRKRQVDSTTPFAAAPSNSTTTGGILARYQLLTPGLILTLAAAFFIALPIVLVGVSALSQIQSPVTKVDMRGPSLDKKNQ